ncbi:MAG TPA: hypothetical protein PKV52_04065 [Candidatus Saccharibacteria bacterium]|nr:hypothetical protein [Candidatus Saccharibacteria bacterium]
MVQLIATVYAIKIVTEIALSPLTMKIITYLKKKERLDTFEEPKLGLYN